jgi:hypothetical protein
MQEPVDIRQRKKPTQTPRPVEVPQSDIIEELVTFAPDELVADDSPDLAEPPIEHPAEECSESSNEITTIVIDDTDDERADDLSDGASDSHRHELRSKIAQQLLGEQHQHQQQLHQQQQHRRHRAKNSRTQSAKVNNSIGRSRRTSSKINSQGNIVELLSDASDHDGDIDNSDNGYEEEDKDSDDDRDHDVREVYNQSKIATDINHFSTRANGSGSNVFARNDKPRQDRSSTLRLRTRVLRNRTRPKQERYEGLHSGASVDGNDGSGDGSQPFILSKFDGSGVYTSTDYNNNSKHFINRNSQLFPPELENERKPCCSSHAKQGSYECSECESTLNFFSRTVSRVLSLIQRGKSSSALHGHLCGHDSRSLTSRQSIVDESRACDTAQNISVVDDNLDEMTEWQDRQKPTVSTSGKRKRDSMPSNYQSFAGPSARKSFKSGKQRETSSLHDRNGYTKLGHSYHQKAQKASFFHEYASLILCLES